MTLIVRWVRLAPAAFTLLLPGSCLWRGEVEAD
jgi:hypothetical protein